jgi:8-oxo-dGTP diphosphatase
VWDGLCGDGRIREPALSEVEGSMPSESRLLLAPPQLQSFARMLAARQTMQREFPETPLVGVGAIIIEDARVVLVKRAHPPLQAEWSIPGGVLEVGELVREAAIREAREETGLTVEPGELLGVYDRVLRNADKRVQYHYVLIDFLCRRIAGDLAAASDASEVRWFSRKELQLLKLAEDTIDVIHKGFARVTDNAL